MAKAVIG